ncbi:hypothetical protein M1D30_05255 [Prevotella sp. E15-22]|uniref:hypothetical protein n=1 Tax=Prevotella sp. E15-22 TaxID=2937774 RepID=UPI002059432B|nr:hypothetical protein [Prevotella sp. E15-22]UPS45578.1 hypothetical protein M1D30_05255 [Prevotella sp. E15-22]
MGILTTLYALLGIGGTTYCASSGIKKLFSRELSNEEFIEKYKEEQKRREDSKKKFHELNRGKKSI